LSYRRKNFYFSGFYYNHCGKKKI